MNCQESYTEIINQTIQTSQKIIGDKNDWDLLKKGAFLSIFAKKYDDTQAYIFKIQGEIPSNIDQITKFYFENNQDMAKNRQSCIGVEVLENLDQNTQISVIKAISVSTNKPVEFLTIRNRVFNSNQILIVNSKLDNHPKLQKNDQVLRSEMAVNFQLLKQKNQDNTYLEMYCLRDPKVKVEEEHLPKIAEILLKIYEKDVQVILQNK
ncbi:mammalian STARD1-STARD15-like lipid-binding START domain protein, putative (macronuclear) [Tetrahymena thermophila SB210]|uniref:Mammalian STARD1-STARD15-like lipid-binding START domain protein, putative n=1 Tax=Tetrahymena thermophila (strain SB210) TaxID=312017 RepID=Q22NQ3_TETTS|nr:mammalian STARD1-STARD15-like lipid-binding START domain protein, putative [Tetrahymena thermophila SB210]EAR86732.1 mammalian STARD1-STARD15-like lipid-binding START domain protein, putative [Tetrahymena thermophila SB210]|eukprot:XP_001006977.1 mammalian STARD1-STARD15-like lipid-binding START domain protein, putative [Tetrahymena thermophila SB210]